MLRKKNDGGGKKEKVRGELLFYSFLPASTSLSLIRSTLRGIIRASNLVLLHDAQNALRTRSRSSAKILYPTVKRIFVCAQYSWFAGRAMSG